MDDPQDRDRVDGGKAKDESFLMADETYNKGGTTKTTTETKRHTK